MKVLIADDDQGMRDILKIFMDRAGHETVTAENGLEALTLLEAGDYDIVITDGFMPQMTGFELCRAVRKRFPHVLTIGLTGSSQLHEFEKAGVHACFYKPVLFSDLTETIEKHYHSQLAAAM
jgi:CheY-like chemotaxis protein